MLISGAERLFWLMVWTIVGLIVFIALYRFLRDKDVPVLSSIFSWADQHAGLGG